MQVRSAASPEGRKGKRPRLKPFRNGEEGRLGNVARPNLSERPPPSIPEAELPLSELSSATHTGCWVFRSLLRFNLRTPPMRGLNFFFSAQLPVGGLLSLTYHHRGALSVLLNFDPSGVFTRTFPLTL